MARRGWIGKAEMVGALTGSRRREEMTVAIKKLREGGRTTMGGWLYGRATPNTVRSP